MPAGHLLGSAYRRGAAARAAQTILFGGDLGRYARPVLPDPADPVAADVLLVRVHLRRSRSRAGRRRRAAGARDHRDTVARGGKVIIPAFAIGRVEEVLYWLKRLEDEKRIPVLPVYVDSPMATEALQFYAARAAELDPGHAADAART